MTKRKIQPAPFEGKIPKEKIQKAIDFFSVGKKIMEKYSKAIKNLGDK